MTSKTSKAKKDNTTIVNDLKALIVKYQWEDDF